MVPVSFLGWNNKQGETGVLTEPVHTLAHGTEAYN
jgi:hypothetical protein